MTEEIMTSRERLRRALTFSHPDSAPRQLWNLPAISMFYNDQLQEVLTQFPLDFGRPDFTYGPGLLVSGTPNVVGAYRDEWGCVWHATEPGVIGEVKTPPLADWSELAHFRPPYEILQKADLSGQCQPGKFHDLDERRYHHPAVLSACSSCTVPKTC